MARKAIDDTKSDCQKVDAQVEEAKSVLTVGWTGEASAAFRSAADEWLLMLRQLVSSINEMGGVLEQNRHGMGTTENEAKQKAASWDPARVNRGWQ